MTDKIILFGLVLMVLNFVRLFLHKKLIGTQENNLYDAGVTPLNFFVFLVLGLLAFLPFTYQYLEGLQMAKPEVLTGIVLSIIKGFIFLPMMYFGHVLRLKSMSSSVFVFPIGLAFSTLLNNAFFGEALKDTALYAIAGIGVISAVFYLKGHVSQVKQGKLFLLSIAILTLMIVLDHNSLQRTNWYSHLFFTSITALVVTSLFLYKQKRLKSCFKVSVFDKKWIVLGFVSLVLEFLIIYTMNKVMHVSLAVVFLQMVVPLIMVYSAFKWHEGNYKEQAAFGLITLILMVIAILQF